MLSRRLICLMCMVLIMALAGNVQIATGGDVWNFTTGDTGSEIVIVPSSTSDDADLIQTTLAGAWLTDDPTVDIAMLADGISNLLDFSMLSRKWLLQDTPPPMP